MFMAAMTHKSFVDNVPAASRRKYTSSAVARRFIKLKGSRNFQAKAINWSTRSRG